MPEISCLSCPRIDTCTCTLLVVEQMELERKGGFVCDFFFRRILPSLLVEIMNNFVARRKSQRWVSSLEFIEYKYAVTC